MASYTFPFTMMLSLLQIVSNVNVGLRQQQGHANVSFNAKELLLIFIDVVGIEKVSAT